MPTDNHKDECTQAISLPVLWLGTQSTISCNGCQFAHKSGFCELFEDHLEEAEDAFHGGFLRLKECKKAAVP